VWQWLPVVAVTTTLLVAALARRRLGRGPVAAAAFFAVTLAPTLGFVDFFFMGWSPVADRFQYLASIGLIALGVAGAARATTDLAVQPWAARAGSAGVLIILGTLTWRQAAVYTSADTYYRAVLAGNPSNEFAQYNFANDLLDRGQVDEALQHFEEAVRIRPDRAELQYVLATVLKSRGRIDEAIQHFEEALRLHPDFPKAHVNLGLALCAGRGRLDERIEEASQHFEEALRLEPDFAEAHYGLAVVLASRGRTDEARAHYAEVIRLNPDFAKAHGNPLKVFSSSHDGR
jgi:tetratricopeptide (TPR) repeat protein